MSHQEQGMTAFESVESIESKYRVNYVDSGMPRWLIEAAFVCCLMQAVFNWSPLLHWMEEHASWALAVIQTFGALVMYIGLLQGMKPLYRPMTVGWWIVIALNIAGFVAVLIPALMGPVGLPVAVSLMVVYLPLGCAIAYCYRGRLRQVGIWMALYILISSIVPVLTYLLFPADSWIGNLSLEVPTIAVIVIYAWVLRRVLVSDGIARACCPACASLPIETCGARQSLLLNLRPQSSSSVPRVATGRHIGNASR